MIDKLGVKDLNDSQEEMLNNLCESIVCSQDKEYWGETLESCVKDFNEIENFNTLKEVLEHPNCKKFAEFLIKQPFLFSKKIKLSNGSKKKIIMVHAGLPHELSFRDCLRLNKLSQKFIQENPKKKP